MKKIASWNPRTKYYVITEPGKKGIQARTVPGNPPPQDCELKGCDGNEWKEFSEQPEQSEKQKKKNSDSDQDSSDSSSKQEQNEAQKDDQNKNWFALIFGTEKNYNQ